MPCQLTDIRDIIQTGGFLHRLSTIGVRFLRILKQKGNQLLPKATHGHEDTPASTRPVTNADQDIRPGDWVEVRCRDEIRKSLDREGKTRGCVFTREMYAHCGSQYKVLKSVTSFFDESKQKLCYCRNVVILEGSVCSGRQRLYTAKCDRNCFFFWQTDWLKKIG
jgi:hypothetical protein